MSRNTSLCEVDQSFKHVLVMPKQKLAFCFVQKVASEHFAQLFNGVNGVNASRSKHAPYRPSRACILGFTSLEVTRQAGWKFAMFVRDPLERYLSAFLDKCVPDGNHSDPFLTRFCHGPTLPRSAALELQVALFEKRAEADVAKGGLPDDAHWTSQRAIMERFCGASKFGVAKLDFLGHMAHDRAEVQLQVQEMLRLTSIRDTGSLVTQFFPSNANQALIRLGGHCMGKAHCTQSHTLLSTFYRKPETVRRVMQLLADDYEYYGFAAPNFTAPGSTLPASETAG